MTRDQFRVILHALRQQRGDIHHLEFSHWGLLVSPPTTTSTTTSTTDITDTARISSISHNTDIDHQRNDGNCSYYDDGTLILQELLLTLLISSDKDGQRHQVSSSSSSSSSRHCCIEELGLTSCGITGGSRLRIIWEFLTYDNFTVRKLNLSRNMLGGIYYQDSLNETFKYWTNNFTTLQELNLSSTGLTVESVSSLFVGLQSNTTIIQLDISNNFDSLEILLYCLIPYLPKLTTLRRLILTNGASSSTCIDYTQEQQQQGQHQSTATTTITKTATTTTTDSILARFTKQSMKLNKSLHFLGPIYILPIDKQATTIQYDAYNRCVGYLNEIQYYLKRNQLNSTIISSITVGNSCSGSGSGTASTATINTTTATTYSSSYLLPMAIQRLQGGHHYHQQQHYVADAAVHSSKNNNNKRNKKQQQQQYHHDHYYDPSITYYLLKETVSFWGL